jgi:hypothetical protein
MTSDDKPDDGKPSADIVAFPFSRTTPAQTADPDVDVTYGAFATVFGIPQEQTTGHWCSHCRKIWYGYLLEVTCPACGNRHG